jgi:hypothetical protein
MLRKLLLTTVLTTCAALPFWEIHIAGATAADGLSADLAFHFQCDGVAYPVHDEAIEIFLASHGFRVLNKRRLQQEHSVAPLYELSIVGIDSRRRAVHLQAYAHQQGVYWLRLQTPAPTRRSPELEDALLAFVADTLRCRVSQVTRGENGEGARELFEETFRLYEGWFRQADELRRRPI